MVARALQRLARGGKLSTAILRKSGYTVRVVQNPTTSLTDDVAFTRRVIDALEGPGLLVGHPYGGAVMAESQVRWGVAALNGAITNPAWRSKRSWYLVATDDHMIPPVAQRSMAKRAKAIVSETPGSHAIYVSHPKEVAAVIAKAAAGMTMTAK